MTLESERKLCAQWRAYAGGKPQGAHVVNACRCFACALCRGLEGVIAEVDKLTGPDDVGSGGVPGGV